MNELFYLAGLVDGEGSVGYSSSGSGRTRFVIEIKMTSENVIDWLVEKYGGAKQYRPSRHPNWKDQWRWRIQGESAKSLYASIKPMLKIKVL
jgi:hypothetical protein